jgi:hypothetical protein
MFFCQLLIALILGLGSPSNGTVHTQTDPPVGGDTGQNPPPK